MNPLHLKIGTIIRTHRTKADMSQLELSRHLGYDSTQFISLFERGLSKCPVKVLGKLCKILDIDQDWMSDLLIQDYKAKVLKEMRAK